MSDQVQRALARIAKETNVDDLLALARNARGKSPEVEREALRRLAALSAKHASGSVHHACWTMVHTVEATRRLKGAKVWRMNRMRRKIDKDGEVAALEYCALKETAGFAEVLAYGMPELTAEAIVLRHSAHFSDGAKAAARQRLEKAGVNLNGEGGII
jgi:hypothetical protein